MGTLYLVRHGQASFGAEDYDRLSELGWRQSRRLGEYFAQKGLRFDVALSGTLRRHIETLDGIRQGLGEPAHSMGEATRLPGLNEYDSGALIAAVHPLPLEKPDTAESYRQHFRLLRQGLMLWISEAAQIQGMPSYPEFLAGVSAALDQVRLQHHGKNVLMVSSGGPISTAVAHVLGAPAESMIDLNLRIRNSSVTEFAFTPKRHMLVTYNTLPHLDSAELASWISYA